MQYHSNHFTCHKSNWDNEPFETAEVCVTIRNNLFLFSNIISNIKNPDFNLLLEEKEIINKKDKMKDVIDTLKPNVLEWLNENMSPQLEDKKDVLEDINGEEIIIDSDESTRYGEFNIYFTRQLDALKFIKTFSIFKDPITYFDYFSYDKREMDLNQIIETINKYNDDKIELNNIKFEIDDSSIKKVEKRTTSLRW